MVFRRTKLLVLCNVHYMLVCMATTLLETVWILSSFDQGRLSSGWVLHEFKMWCYLAKFARNFMIFDFHNLIHIADKLSTQSSQFLIQLFLRSTSIWNFKNKSCAPNEFSDAEKWAASTKKGNVGSVRLSNFHEWFLTLLNVKGLWRLWHTRSRIVWSSNYSVTKPFPKGDENKTKLRL